MKGKVFFENNPANRFKLLTCYVFPPFYVYSIVRVEVILTLSIFFGKASCYSNV